MKKVAEPLSLVRPFSPKRIFQGVANGETIDRCLTSKNARFPLVIVV